VGGGWSETAAENPPWNSPLESSEGGCVGGGWSETAAENPPWNSPLESSEGGCVGGGWSETAAENPLLWEDAFMNPEWRSRYEAAVEITSRAAQTALRYFEAAVAVEWKHDQSPVTIADRETEQLLRTSLKKHFPGDGFLGEEYGDTPGESGFRWIIDPIDGTRSFVRGIPLWATLVGLEYRGEMIAGMVEAPALGQSWRALRGDGAFRNHKPIRVSDEGTVARSLIFYSGLNWFVRAGKEKVFLELVRRTDRQRGFGDFYGFVLLAQGSGEAMIDIGVHSWDVAAVKPLIEEAGGRMTAWDGTETIHRSDVFATNGKLHVEFQQILTQRDEG
jgi:histidinol-phosphatase